MKLFYSFASFLFLSYLLVINTATAQNNYLPAYVVDNTGDTIKGFIDYKNWGINPEKIYFKASQNSDVKTYAPSIIKSFSVCDELYFSAKVEMETSPEVSNLDKDAELHIVTDSVFLQTLVLGSKSLFYFKSPAGKSNFYILKDGVYELLQHKKYLKTTSNDIVLAENKKYIGQLTIYFGDCDYIKTKLSKVKYTQRSLINSFETYYKCEKQKPDFTKKEEKIIFEKGVFAGVSSTTLKIGGQGVKDIPDFSVSNDFTMGLSFDLLLPRNQRMWSIVNEINVPGYEVEDTYINKDKDTIHVEMGYRYLKINNMLRFSYPLKDIRIFINAGMANGFALTERNYMKRIPDGLYFNTIKESEFLNSRKYEQSILGGLGIRWNKLSVEFRSEYGNGMSKNPVLSTKTLRHYLLVGFKF